MLAALPTICCLIRPSCSPPLDGPAGQGADALSAGWLTVLGGVFG
jgi:hypothetical protein